MSLLRRCPFGPNFRSFSSRRPRYAPRTIENFASKFHSPRYAQITRAGSWSVGSTERLLKEIIVGWVALVQLLAGIRRFCVVRASAGSGRLSTLAAGGAIIQRSRGMALLNTPTNMCIAPPPPPGPRYAGARVSLSPWDIGTPLWGGGPG